MLKNFAWLILALALRTSTSSAQPTIDSSNWPYGSDQIGNYWHYQNATSNVGVDIAALNPYAHGGYWDFSTGPTGLTATSEIRQTSQAPAPPPPNTSFVEYQTSGQGSQWVYEDENDSGIWARGISQQGVIYTYNSPQYNSYHYPMTIGTSWASAWTWDVSGITIQSSRANEIVGWGTVSVPVGGPMPCLVIRQLYSDYGEFQGIPIVDEAYRIYEWIVPNIGSVATIQSVSHESNWYFNTASAFYRLYETNLGGDLSGPAITSVTILADTAFGGPYTVTASITDESGVDLAYLYYSVNGGGYAARSPENINGDLYEFLIPALVGFPVQEVRYFMWAQDGSANQNESTAPPNAPDSSYSFSWINDNTPPQFTEVTIWPSPAYFNGPYPVEATITDASSVLFSSIHYKLGSGAWEEAAADGNVGDVYTFTIPPITSTTIIRYYLEAVDNSGSFNTGYYPSAGINGPIVFQAVYTVPAAPEAILDLTIHPSGSDVNLNWTDVTLDVNGNPITISHYEIYRGIQADGSDFALIGTSTTSDYTDPGAVDSGTIYFYNVRAVTP